MNPIDFIKEYWSQTLLIGGWIFSFGGLSYQFRELKKNITAHEKNKVTLADIEVLQQSINMANKRIDRVEKEGEARDEKISTLSENIHALLSTSKQTNEWVQILVKDRLDN